MFHSPRFIYLCLQKVCGQPQSYSIQIENPQGTIFASLVLKNLCASIIADIDFELSPLGENVLLWVGTRKISLSQRTSSASLATFYASDTFWFFFPSTREVSKGWIIRQKKIVLWSKAKMLFHVNLSLIQELIDQGYRLWAHSMSFSCLRYVILNNKE